MAGDALIYTADSRNIHSVEEITDGERLTLTLWFSRDKSHDEDCKLISFLTKLPFYHPDTNSDGYLPIPLPASQNMYWFPPEESTTYHSGFDIRCARLHVIGCQLYSTNASLLEDVHSSSDFSDIILEPIRLVRGNDLFDYEFANILHLLQVVQFYHWKAPELKQSEVKMAHIKVVPISTSQQDNIQLLKLQLLKDQHLAETIFPNKNRGEHDWVSFFSMVNLWESYTKSNTYEDESHQHRRFFLLSNGGTMRKLPLPEAHRQRCISSHGWLLTTGEQEFYTKLVNPLSGTQIDLPELYMFEELYFDQDEWVYYGFSMRKVVFTSSNPSDPSFRVIIIWGKTIGFCRPGDASWARINGWKGGLFDITYHSLQKRLYIVTTMGIIYECDIIKDVSSPLTLSLVTTFPAKEFGCGSLPWAYLLEWGHNSLLMITRERQYFKKHDDGYERYGPYKTNMFQCFMFGLDDEKWSTLTSLGDKAVFIGFNSSFSVIGDGEGVKPNCIYFTDDLYEPYRGLPDGGGGDVGIYHMSNGTIETIFGSQQSVFRDCPPLWLQTNTLPVISSCLKGAKDV